MNTNTTNTKNTAKCVFTTTTAVRGSAWGSPVVEGGNVAQREFFMDRVESALETVAPCAEWYPSTSEVHACLAHAEALADFVDGEGPSYFLDDDDWSAIWDMADPEE